MGKNLKGREGGKGICQRKDGLYCARFVDKRGKGMRSVFQPYPNPVIRLLTLNMQISMKMYLFPRI